MVILTVLAFITCTCASLCMEPAPLLNFDEPAYLILAPFAENNDELLVKLYREIARVTQSMPIDPIQVGVEAMTQQPLCYAITQEMARNLVSLKKDGMHEDKCCPQCSVAFKETKPRETIICKCGLQFCANCLKNHDPKIGCTDGASSNHKCKKIETVFFKAQGHPPLYPAMDAAMYAFYKMFVGPYLAPSCLIILKNVKLERPNPEYTTQIAQASLAVEGIRFHEFIIKEAKKERTFSDLDMKAISAFYIAMLLTNPSDYKAKNLIVQDKTNTLMGIDNDEALVPSICLDKNKATLKERHFPGIKHILYCMPELLNVPIDIKMVEDILSIDSRERLSLWLAYLKRYNENHAYLTKILGAEDLELLRYPFKLPKGTLTHMYKMLNSVKGTLSDHRNGTHYELLLANQPLVTQYYNRMTEKACKQDNRYPCLVAYERVNTTQEEFALENVLNIHASISKIDRRPIFRALRQERTTEDMYKSESNSITLEQSIEELALCQAPTQKDDTIKFHEIINESKEDDETLLKNIEHYVKEESSLAMIDKGGNAALDHALEKRFLHLVCFFNPTRCG